MSIMSRNDEESIMNKKTLLLTALLALPLAVSGVVYGQRLVGDGQPPANAGYTCPLTGEELACPSCCPLTEAK